MLCFVLLIHSVSSSTHCTVLYCTVLYCTLHHQPQSDISHGEKDCDSRKISICTNLLVHYCHNLVELKN